MIVKSENGMRKNPKILTAVLKKKHEGGAQMNIQKPETLPSLLKVSEAAQSARKGPNFIYFGVRDGLIPAVRLGKSIRIPRDRFLAFLNGEVTA